jgi:hypothetical protein
MSQKIENLGVIVEQHHNMCITRHGGYFKLIVCNYWWPQMSRYMEVYIKTATFAIGPSCNTVNLTESSTPQRLQKIDRMSSVLTLFVSFLKHMAMTSSW